MELDSLRNILIDANHDSFQVLQAEFIEAEIFESLCGLLHDNNSRVRFFVLYYLIANHKNLLAKANADLTDDIYRLIHDTDEPVADRAVWALGIIGDHGLNKLILEYQSNVPLNKSRIVMAIGRSHFPHRSKDRIDILLDALVAEDENVSFCAMCALMSNSPISPWKQH